MNLIQLKCDDLKGTNKIGKEAKSTKSVHGSLCRLRFLLSMHVWNKRDVYQGKVIMTNAKLELAHSLDKWG